MKKTFACFLLLGILLSLCGCIGPGPADWRYDDLPGGYLLIRSSSTDIRLCYSDGGDEYSHHLLPFELVWSFSKNDRYIGAMVLIPTRDDYEEYADFSDFVYHRATDDDCAYYLVDTETHEIFGSYDRIGYYEKLEEIGVSDMTAWSTPLSHPEGAH